jgi:uncharacterized protein YaeQ
MGNPARLYRFRISVSDVERSFYEELDFRAAMHPSETDLYLVTRVIAYALNHEPGIEFSPGLCTGDEPAIRVPDSQGGIALWVDIGNPSPRKLHKAAKASRRVRVYTYKDAENLRRECADEAIHRAQEIEVFSLDERFLSALAATLERDNQWTLLLNGGELTVSAGAKNFQAPLGSHRLG